jgi:predicted DNA-binding transcriptional regulator YafY
VKSASPRPGARVVKLLRILESSPKGCRVDELAAACAVSVAIVARDLGQIREADEPLEATGSLLEPETRVRLAN